MELLEVLGLLKRRLGVLLAAVLLCGLAGLALSLLLHPVYEAQAKLIVSTRSEETSSVTSDQISSAEQLVDVYAVILRSRSVLEPIIDRLGLDVDYETLYSRVQVYAVEQTQVMALTARAGSREEALAILTALVEAAPDALTEAVEAGSVRTVEEPGCAEKPVFPDRALFVILSGLLGGLAAAAAVSAHGLCTVQSEDDLRRVLDVPVLGCIPRSRAGRDAQPVVEAYKTLATNLSAHNTHLLILTSARSGEGKSTVAVNLAHALGRTGARVLLMDCNFRAPALHRMLGVKEQPGLSTLLQEETAPIRVHRRTDMLLDLIPAGPKPPSATELLGGRVMGAMLLQLAETYDYILCDAPQALGVADAGALSRQGGGVLLVVRQGMAHRKELRRAKATLELAGATVTGAVLVCAGLRH